MPPGCQGTFWFNFTTKVFRQGSVKTFSHSQNAKLKQTGLQGDHEQIDNQITSAESLT